MSGFLFSSILFCTIFLHTIYFPSSLPHCLIGSFLFIVSYVDPLYPLAFSHLYDSGCLENIEAFFLFMLTSMSSVKTYFFSISYVQLSLTFTLIECLYFLIVYPFSTHTHTLSHRHRSAKSHQLCPTLCNPWTVAHQTPLSMGFSRQG